MNNKELSFKPILTKRSERLPGRSVYELSKGDMIRKETNTRMLKLRIEQEELGNSNIYILYTIL